MKWTHIVDAVSIHVSSLKLFDRFRWNLVL